MMAVGVAGLAATQVFADSKLIKTSKNRQREQQLSALRVLQAPIICSISVLHVIFA